jgi:hypothetical protein
MKIRIALDDRDCFTERKREAAYQLLCRLGSHPTYTGFQMLQAKGSNLVIIGAFFEPASLDAVLSELAKTIMQAGSQAGHAEERNITDYRMSLDYLSTQADWSDHFLGFNAARQSRWESVLPHRSMFPDVDAIASLECSRSSHQNAPRYPARRSTGNVQSLR